MKQLYFLAFLLLGTTVTAQNTMLSGQTTGQLFSPGTGMISDIELVDNGTDVVLIAANDPLNEFYAIDIADNNPADAAANTITQIPNFQAVIDGATGQSNLNIVNIEVNPISKSVYVLAHGSGFQSYIVKIEDNGGTVSTLDYSNQTFSQIDWAGTNSYEAQDLTFGNGSLYITSGTWSLDGEIAWVAEPFVHNSTTTSRATSMFKTNWGGNYFTTAPLERLDFATINSEDRLLGVTVCAPGFSLKTSDLAGAGVLQVTEDFNIRFSPPTKVVHQFNDNTHWLFDLHSFSNVLIRVGEEYLDGSPVSNNMHNNNAVLLRDGAGNPTAGLTDTQVKIYAETFTMISFWDEENLLVVENDVLKLFETGPNAASIQDLSINMSIYPNPASDVLSVSIDKLVDHMNVVVRTMDGKEVINQPLTNTNMTFDLSELSAGAYALTLTKDGQVAHTQKLVVE